MRTFSVIVADLETSRKVERRRAFAEELRAALSATVGRFPIWFADLTPTRGIDELSGVLHEVDRAFDIMVDLNIQIWPHRFRFALARGVIDVGLESTDAGAMDGTAFHRGADALDRAKTEGLALAIELPFLDRREASVVEQLATLHGDIMRRWTPREAESVRIYRETGSQVRAAKRLGVTQQATSDALRRGLAGRLVECEQSIRSWFKYVDSKGTDHDASGPGRR
ncbi:MAG: hypothetical protein ACF8PN_09635 [Phycisphaerales bacterium]